jgi:hypothetical protein
MQGDGLTARSLSTGSAFSRQLSLKLLEIQPPPTFVSKILCSKVERSFQGVRTPCLAWACTMLQNRRMGKSMGWTAQMHYLAGYGCIQYVDGSDTNINPWLDKLVIDNYYLTHFLTCTRPRADGSLPET